jgi:hypothetical protein
MSELDTERDLTTNLLPSIFILFPNEREPVCPVLNWLL